jgi:hypothetical protein
MLPELTFWDTFWESKSRKGTGFTDENRLNFLIFIRHPIEIMLNEHNIFDIQYYCNESLQRVIASSGGNPGLSDFKAT